MLGKAAECQRWPRAPLSAVPQVNASPSLARENALDHAVKEPLLRDTLELVAPPYFDRVVWHEMLRWRIAERNGERARHGAGAAPLTARKALTSSSRRAPSSRWHARTRATPPPPPAPAPPQPTYAHTHRPLPSPRAAPSFAAELCAMLHGEAPVAQGAPPRRLGQYERIAPSPTWERVVGKRGEKQSGPVPPLQPSRRPGQREAS